MPKRPKKTIVEKKLTPEQEAIYKKVVGQVMDLKLDAIYNIERQDTNYGKNKSHSWKDNAWNVKDARISLEQGMIDHADVKSNRIFNKSGYSIEIKSYLGVDAQTKEVKPGITLIALSDSVERDSEGGFIKHNEMTKIAYIRLFGSEVDLIIPDAPDRKAQSMEDFEKSALMGRRVNVLDGKKSARNLVVEEKSDWLEKMAVELGNVDDRFPELLEALVSNREKQFVDAQPDNTTLLQDLLNKKKKDELDATLKKSLTTEDVKKTTGFFGKLFGKDKDKDSQGR